MSNQYSCNLEIEELRSLVQFYLISAMAGRDRRLRRRVSGVELVSATKGRQSGRAKEDAMRGPFFFLLQP